jgi:hypothetical protein
VGYECDESLVQAIAMETPMKQGQSSERVSICGSVVARNGAVTAKKEPFSSRGRTDNRRAS